jgi:chemotaxis protein CheY-P-specific phosphatase CheC
MDKELLTKAMKASISEVLEKMFFLPLDFFDSKEPGDLWQPDTVELIAIRLDFSGPAKGYFVFFIPRELCVALCADFMGIEPDSVTPEHVDQTAKEIINMIAGSTFTALDENEVFDLGIPDAAPAQSLWTYDGEADNEIFLGIETINGKLGLRSVMS